MQNMGHGAETRVQILTVNIEADHSAPSSPELRYMLKLHIVITKKK